MPEAVSPADVVDTPLTPQAADAVGATTPTREPQPTYEPPIYDDEPEAAETAWDRPIVAAARSGPSPVVVQELPPLEPAEDDVPLAIGAHRSSSRLTMILSIVTLAAAVVAAGRIADREGWYSTPDTLARAGALIASWGAIVLLARRCGGRQIIIGGFAAAALGLVAAFPEEWALAGAGVAGASAFGVLAMVLTRPATGVRVVRELLISAFIGLAGAAVVAGYDVELRPYRFRVMVLGLVLVGAFALAWRLGHGARSVGRRGVVLIVFGVVVLAASVAYAQAIRSWGSPDVVNTLDDFSDWITKYLGATPRPVEAIVGFPALVWGVWVRNRRRQGWWMSAFGALGAAGVTSSLIQDDSLSEAMQATGYNVLIGGLLGVFLILLDSVLTKGGGRRGGATGDVDPERPEPPRFEALM